MGVRCFTIPVPDDREYIAAFRGALLALASGYNWDDDDAHTAKEVALVWRDILDKVDAQSCASPAPATIKGGIDIGGADLELRIKPTDNCIIQINCAGEWEDWYDPRSCIGDSLAQPTSETGEIEPGVCLEYDVVLRANDVWMLPAGVQNGDIITITEVSGGWYDGSSWFCPNGQPNVYGECLTTGRALDGSDPVTSAYHMELVALFGAGGKAADNQSIVISGLSGPSTFTLQANDASLSDNFGSISFHVKACSGTPTRVKLSYLLGANGPADVGIGEEFDYNVSVFDGSAWNGGIEFDPCCSLTLVSQTGSVVTSADWYDCASGLHSGFNLAGVTRVGTSSSVGAFMLHLRLDSI